MQVSTHTQGVRVHEHTLKPPMIPEVLVLAQCPVPYPLSLSLSSHLTSSQSRSVLHRPGRSAYKELGSLVWGRGSGGGGGSRSLSPHRCPFWPTPISQPGRVHGRTP